MPGKWLVWRKAIQTGVCMIVPGLLSACVAVFSTVSHIALALLLMMMSHFSHTLSLCHSLTHTQQAPDSSVSLRILRSRKACSSESTSSSRSQYPPSHSPPHSLQPQQQPKAQSRTLTLTMQTRSLKRKHTSPSFNPPTSVARPPTNQEQPCQYPCPSSRARKSPRPDDTRAPPRKTRR